MSSRLFVLLVVLLSLPIVVMAQDKKDVVLNGIVRTGVRTDKKVTYHLGEVYAERGRLILFDAGVILFDDIRAWEIFFGAGVNLVSKEKFYTSFEALFDKECGVENTGGWYFIPWSVFGGKFAQKVTVRKLVDIFAFFGKINFVNSQTF